MRELVNLVNLVNVVNLVMLAASAKLELCLVDVQRLDAMVKGGRRNAEPRGSPRGPGDTAPALGERGFDDLPFAAWLASRRRGEVAGGSRRTDCAGSHDSSTAKTSLALRITDRSITFCSSRMLPGQSYACNKSSVFLSIERIVLPALEA